MTLNIGEHSPVNVVRVNGVLRSQYIILTNDIDSFLSADIKRKTITETTITVTYSILNVDTLLNLMEEQDGSN